MIFLPQQTCIKKMELKIKILVVEEDPSRNKKILKYLESYQFEVFNNYFDFENLPYLITKIKPHIIICFIFDLKKILNLINSINIIYKDCRFIIVSNTFNLVDLISGIDKGIMGWISGDIAQDFFIAAINQVINGGFVVFTKDASNIIKKTYEKSLYLDNFFKTSNLTEREIEVLTLLAEGASNKTIANVLFISGNTVKTHVRNILEKLQIRSRTQAALYAIDKGLKKTDLS
jgi:DNA-binding NarL/FixJ family response regulator